MSEMDQINPFHEGELKAQARAGVGDIAKWAGGFIRDYLPEQHRKFYSGLPFLIVSGGDEKGRTWITMLDGPDGFATSPDPQRIFLDRATDKTDPLASAFADGTDVGVLGIELASRRRNRFSGHIRSEKSGYEIDIRQTFGNCPQYIHERALTRVATTTPTNAQRSATLTQAQITQIRAADTMFIGSGHQGENGATSNGYDASHRGGAPGFVHVLDPTHLKIPDYAGNNFFNTIGNLVCNPKVGLLFVDFESGGLLHITGRATIDWDPRGTHDPDAWRMIDVEIDEVLERPGAVGLRWSKLDHLARLLKVTKRVEESDSIMSFFLEPIDGRPLEPFEPGHHLPIEVQIPGQAEASKRSYSLSGLASDLSHYRLSIKREDKGLVSRFFHDQLREGSLIKAQKPAGDFVVPYSNYPLVLVSAGVGLTPMVSALHANKQQKEHNVWFVHGARNRSEHALKDEVDALINHNAFLHSRIFYSRPNPTDRLGLDYDVKGRISADRLIELGAGPDARYMLCGPVAFLADIRNGLEAAGIPADHIHFEIFGPAG